MLFLLITKQTLRNLIYLRLHLPRKTNIIQFFIMLHFKKIRLLGHTMKDFDITYFCWLEITNCSNKYFGNTFTLFSDLNLLAIRYLVFMYIYLNISGFWIIDIGRDGKREREKERKKGIERGRGRERERRREIKGLRWGGGERGR